MLSLVMVILAFKRVKLLVLARTMRSAALIPLSLDEVLQLVYFILSVGSTLNSENSPEIRNRRLRVSSAIYGLGGEQCCTRARPTFSNTDRRCARKVKSEPA